MHNVISISAALIAGLSGMSAQAGFPPQTDVYQAAEGLVGPGIYPSTSFGTYSASTSPSWVMSDVEPDTSMNAEAYADMRSSVSLTYTVEFSGPTSAVAVNFQAYMGGSNSYADPYDNGGRPTWGGTVQIQGLAEGIMLAQSMGVDTNAGNPSISVDQTLNFMTGQWYVISLGLVAEGEDYLDPTTDEPTFGITTAWADPTFAVEGPNASAYTISYSSGIVPNVSSVPEPTNALLLLIGIASLFARRRITS